MKTVSKSEWFVLDSPIGEPNVKWNPNDEYNIERVVKRDGSVVWFGLAVNWKKDEDGNWGVLTTNENAKPLEKYLPEIVYSEDDRYYFKKCEMPIYEKLYLEMASNTKI
jgi:hypothetical protein